MIAAQRGDRDVEHARLARRAGRAQRELAIGDRLAGLERAPQQPLQPVRLVQQLRERAAARLLRLKTSRSWAATLAYTAHSCESSMTMPVESASSSSAGSKCESAEGGVLSRHGTPGGRGAPDGARLSAGGPG